MSNFHLWSTFSKLISLMEFLISQMFGISIFEFLEYSLLRDKYEITNLHSYLQSYLYLYLYLYTLYTYLYLYLYIVCVFVLMYIYFWIKTFVSIARMASVFIDQGWLVILRGYWDANKFLCWCYLVHPRYKENQQLKMSWFKFWNHK